MLTAFLNTLKVKELRNRLLFTALIIVLVRFASNIPCPGVDPAALEKFISEVSAGSSSSGGFMALIDLFSGGALAHFALGALAIMPYITASIIVQLLVPAASGGYFADRLRTDLLLAARGAAADHDQPGLSGHRRRHRRRVGKAAGRNAGSDRCRHAAVPADFTRKRPGTVKIL